MVGHDDELGVAQRILSTMPRFTPAERRIARALLGSYPFAGLDTVAALAETAGTSAPTVMRFARALGFDGYRDFQAALRAEVRDRQESNLSQATARWTDAAATTLATTDGDDDADPDAAAGSAVEADASPEDAEPGAASSSGGRGAPDPVTAPAVLDRARGAYVEGIHRTFGTLPGETVERVVALLADERRRVVAFGGSYTRLMAELLVAQLAPARGGVRTLPADPLLAAVELADLRAGDVVVAFDVRRYDAGSVDRARAAKDAGARVVLVTDRWLSPVAPVADHVLTAEVRAAGPSDTLVPTLALVEALCELVVEEIGASAVERLRRVDASRARLA